MPLWKRWSLRWGIAGVAGLLLLQLVPVLPRTNPPTVREPAWDRPETRSLARRACFDCHSNETLWPWYAYLAPARWLVVKDVRDGRAAMNFSDWHPGDIHPPRVAEMIASGRMPLPRYLLLHPEARLSAAEKAALAQGLQHSLQENPLTTGGSKP